MELSSENVERLTSVELLFFLWILIKNWFFLLQCPYIYVMLVLKWVKEFRYS